MSKFEISENYSEDVPKGLLNKVLQRISFEQRAVLMRRRFLALAALFVAFLPALYKAFWAFVADASHSGFGEYLRLLFSDSGAVLSNWKDFAQNLLEAMPAGSLIIVCLVAFVLLVITKYLVSFGSNMSAKNLKNNLIA